MRVAGPRVAPVTIAYSPWRVKVQTQGRDAQKSPAPLAAAPAGWPRRAGRDGDSGELPKTMEKAKGGGDRRSPAIFGQTY